MGNLARVDEPWTAARFLATDQHQFGDAWRYELVDGIVVLAHAAPAPDHAAIVVNLAAALAGRLRSQPGGCRVEAGSGAAPRHQQRPTARIPDVMIRCDKLPRVLLEVVSPSELRGWAARDRKRRDLQDVEGVQEIVEIYQREPAIHIYARAEDGSWQFRMVDGLDATLHLQSFDLAIPLSEIYDGIDFDDPAEA